MAREGRLVIETLLLHNFKSYSGEHRIGPFHECFTAVIGPNGSGKSNVIDALLFVFGKRSRKLRMHRISEMIHCSARHQGNAFAKVTVFFHAIHDSAEGFEVVDGSEFSVARIAHANNRSEYQLNGTPVPFGQISTLLKSKGIDLDNNRFLILQGEVELISQMPPKGTDVSDVGLLEYLEEIVGSEKYIDQIQQHFEKLEAATSEKENMQRRVKTVEQETAKLAERKGDAENFLRREAECITLKIQCNAHAALHLGRSVEEMEKQILALQNAMEASATANDGLKREVEKSREQSKEMETKCRQLNSELEGIGRQVANVECGSVRLAAEQKHLEAEMEKLLARIADLQQEMQDTAEAAKQANSQIPKLRSAITAMGNNLEAQEKRLVELRAQFAPEVAALNTELTEARLLAAPFRQRLAEIEGNLNLTKTEHRVLTNKARQSREEVQEILTRLEVGDKHAMERRHHLQTENGDISRLKKAAKELERGLVREKVVLEKLEAEVERQEEEVEEAKKATASLFHQNKAMQLLSNAKTTGAIPGIYGQLGDLGSIDRRYDLAISNCCSALDYIVVETVEDAEAAGELLKQKRMGAMTFLIREKQTQLEQKLQTAFKAPPGSSRLFDLLRVSDEKLKVAFYYGLRDMLVTDSLERATQIAFGEGGRRWNVVTMKGELLSEAGAMTGGGVPRKGRMRLGEMPSKPMLNQTEAAQLEEAATARLLQTKQELQELQRRYQQSTESCTQQKAALHDRMAALRKREVEAEAEEKELRALKQTLLEKQAAAEVSPEEASKLMRLEQEIQGLERQHGQIRAEATEHLGTVEEIEGRIETVGNGALKQQSEHLQKLKEEIRASEKQITQCQWTIDSAPGKLEQFAKAEKGLRQKEQSLEAQAQVRGENHRQVQEELESLCSKRDGLRDALSAEQDAAKQFKKSMDELMAKAQAVLEQEENFKSQMEAVQTSYHAEKHRAEKTQTEIKSLQDRFAECLPDEEVPEFVEEELQLLDLQSLERQIRTLSTELEGTQINLASVYQYRDKKKELTEKRTRLEELTENRNRAMQGYEDAKNRRLKEFLAGFKQIREELKRVYRSITSGGDADLELVDTFDPFSEGIEFSVRPPNKSWKKIGNLSGGEKTLSSLSLIFALHYYHPTPLYVMDEIDAALDFRNVAITANYIAERTRNAQFIVISLRNQMFDKAENLVGVYKLQDCSRSLTVHPRKYQPSAVCNGAEATDETEVQDAEMQP